MALIDEVKAACDRLAPLGWRDLLLAATGGALDVAQATPAALKGVLGRPLAAIDRRLPGFDDFHPDGARGIVPGRPAESLLYHAFASPRVARGKGGALLGGFPTLTEIEAVENLVFGIDPPTLASVVAASGAERLAVAVYATEYRPAPDCADGVSSDLTFSRTGIARVGTARPKYRPDVRGCWPEDEDNPHAFRVVPVRFTAWLAAPVRGDKARVMRPGRTDDAERRRTFWIPVHKLFDGPECLRGLDLRLVCSARFFNMKLQRVRKSLAPDGADLPTGFPYVIEQDLAELRERSEFGRVAVVPAAHESLVRPAVVDGEPLTFTVPANTAGGFAAYTTRTLSRDGLDAEIHPYPAYVHARTKVVDGALIDLNDEADVNAEVDRGGYEALLYIDTTGEGWVDVGVPALAGQPGVAGGSRAAYVLLGAPDFFPSCGQRELGRWANSESVPASFRGGQIWAVPPGALSETRLPANLQLPGSPFDPREDTVSAVVGMGAAGGAAPPMAMRPPDALRASTLPDDGAGVFAPGWDASVDVRGDLRTGTPHLAAYGLGSPFPEDAKLCAALSTFWPAVAPDVYRTLSPHTGNARLRGTVAPLTDEEIGQVGSLPWDGVPGPRLVRVGDQDFAEMASFANADYVLNAVENRFSGRLTARVTTEEYQRRVLAAARAHWVLSGGLNVAPTRKDWLMLSFRRVSPGDPELQRAQGEAGHVLGGGAVYRLEMCFVGEAAATAPSPAGPRFRRLPVRRRNSFFVSPTDPLALRRRGTDPGWGRARAE
jgi:hypothetical protein